MWIWNGPRPNGSTSRKFINTLDYPVSLFWEDTPSGTIQAGGEMVQNTNHDHIFHAFDPEDNKVLDDFASTKCIETYTVPTVYPTKPTTVNFRFGVIGLT